MLNQNIFLLYDAFIAFYCAKTRIPDSFPRGKYLVSLENDFVYIK